MNSLLRFIGKAFLILVAFALVVRIISVMDAGDEDMIMQDSIAVLRLEGVILDSRDLEDRLKKLDENEHVKGIVLEIDSPGGAIAPTQVLYMRLEKIKKPVYAVMGSMAASGGYYTAAACDRIYALDSTITGSIGVIMEYTNIQGLLDKLGIKAVVVKSGKMKDVPSPTRDLTPEEQQYLQANINDYYEQFLRDILKYRKIDEKKLRELADGRIFSGRQAVGLKLVDEIGTKDDAVDEMKAYLGDENLEVVEIYEEEEGVLRQLFSQVKNFSATHLNDGGVYYIYRPGL